MNLSLPKTVHVIIGKKLNSLTFQNNDQQYLLSGVLGYRLAIYLDEPCGKRCEKSNPTIRLLTLSLCNPNVETNVTAMQVTAVLEYMSVACGTYMQIASQKNGWGGGRGDWWIQGLALVFFNCVMPTFIFSTPLVLRI